jgi:aspartate aminotransferase-like enzyme
MFFQQVVQKFGQEGVTAILSEQVNLYSEMWASWHPTRVNMPTNTVLALRASMTKILSEGLDLHLSRQSITAREFRKSL